MSGLLTLTRCLEPLRISLIGIEKGIGPVPEQTDVSPPAVSMALGPRAFPAAFSEGTSVPSAPVG